MIRMPLYLARVWVVSPLRRRAEGAIVDSELKEERI